MVLRATVDGGPDTVVVKVFAGGGEGWLREAAALSLLNGRGAAVPALLAAVDRPPLVVTADLGSGLNLADALLGADPSAAAGALEAWADALASVHAATAGDGAGYAAALAVHAGDFPADLDTTEDMLGTAAATLERQLPALGVTPTPAALTELRTAADVMGTDALALSPTDTCPDNNVTTPAGLVLLDFEGAVVRHVAWDAAYLQVPWPSCWCAWRLPAEVSAAALARWRTAVAPSLPAGFDEALCVATVAWAFVSTSWFLDRALADDPPPEDPRLHGLAPTRRAMIAHRLDGVLSCDPVLPALGELASELLGVTRARWGDVQLALAPAFL